MGKADLLQFRDKLALFRTRNKSLHTDRRNILCHIREKTEIRIVDRKRTETYE